MAELPHPQVLRECLAAAARGPFFPDWEFSTLFGLDREELDALATSFDPSAPLGVEARRAIHSSVNNLLGYLHEQDSVWADWISVSPERLREIFEVWTAGNVA